jgi:hypothetical protein
MKKLLIGTSLILFSCTATQAPSNTPSDAPLMGSAPTLPQPLATAYSPIFPETTPTPFPTPIAVFTPVSPAPTPTGIPTEPTPSPTSVPSMEPPAFPEYVGKCPTTQGYTGTIETDSMRGKVVDQLDEPVENVTIRVRSLIPCERYYSETLTDENGEYQFSNISPSVPIEIEISSFNQPSAFYTTKLKSNKQGLPEINYFPFKVKKTPLQVTCIALAPSLVETSGTVLLENDVIPANSEAIVRLKTLDMCNPFNKSVLTNNLSYSMSVLTTGSPAQLTVSFPGYPTKVEKVSVSVDKGGVGNLNMYNTTMILPTAWEELSPVWTKGYRSGIGNL